MVSLVIILIYILYIVINYGIPHSLSATYYSIKHNWIFSIVLFISTTLLIPDLLIMKYPYLIFLAICGILFVAVAPNFRSDSLTDSVHTWSAVGTLIFSLLWVGLININILLLWIPILIYAINDYKIYKKDFIDKSNIKFWAEIVMLITLYSVIL